MAAFAFLGLVRAVLTAFLLAAKAWSIQAPTNQHVQFNLRHVEPTTLHGAIPGLQPLDQTTRFCRCPRPGCGGWNPPWLSRCTAHAPRSVVQFPF